MENLKIKIDELREKLLSGQEHLIDTKALEDLSLTYKTSVDANNSMWCDIFRDRGDVFKDGTCGPFRDRFINK